MSVKCAKNNSDAGANNADGVISQILTAPVLAARTIARSLPEYVKAPIDGSRADQIRNAVRNYAFQKLTFTKTMVQDLERLGYKQAARINDLFKMSRAKTEEYLRYAKVRVLEPMTNVRNTNPEAYKIMLELADRMTNTQVDIFSKEASDYAGKTETFIDSKTLEDTQVNMEEEYAALEVLLDELKAVDKNGEAVNSLKNMFETYRYFRDEYIDTIIELVKVKSGEKGVADNETKPDTFAQIEAIKQEFAASDRDAYMALLRQGDFIVNIHEPLRMEAKYTPAKLLEEGVDPAIVAQMSDDPLIVPGKKIASIPFLTRKEQIEFAIRAKAKYGDDLVNTFTKSDIINAEDKLTKSGVSKVSDTLEKIKIELKKSILNTDEAEAIKDPLIRSKRLQQIANLNKELNTIANFALPETSVKKNLLNTRQGLPGYETDILQTFAEMSTRYATQLGTLQNMGEYRLEINSLKEQIKYAPDSTEEQIKNNDTAQKLADSIEGVRIRQTQMPTALDKMANFANRTGFLWYLGFNPASALINMTQVPGVTMPLLLSRFGNTPKGMADVEFELLAAYKTVFKNAEFLTSGTMSERLETLKLLDDNELKSKYDLTRDELDMLLYNDQRGELRSGMQMYDMDQSLRSAGKKEIILEKFNKVSAFMFQKAELVNREVTALAAYRLSVKRKQLGKTKVFKKGSQEAYRFTNDMITESQGSYAADQAPQIFMNPAIRTLAMFKKFPSFMAAVYINMFKQIYRGDSPEIRKQALYQFTLLMGMSALMAGASGMPFYYILRDIMNRVFGSDPNEPYDFNLSFMKSLEDTLGEKGARIVYKGLLNELTGVDVASRVGYQSSFLLGGGDIGYLMPFVGGILGIREVPDYSPSEKADFIFDELLGAGFSMLTGFGKGMDDIMQGHTLRGIEKMTPVFLRNPLKTARYTMDDNSVLTKRGDPVVEDLAATELIFQFMGFSPSRVSLQYEVNRRAKNIEQEILNRRTNLANKYFLLEKQYGRGSAEARDYYLTELVPFSKAFPEIPLDNKFLNKSRKIRRKFTDTKIFDGVSLNKSLQRRLLPYQQLLNDED